MAIGEIGLTSSMRSNLISLQTTSRLMGSTEEKLATGKRINNASDNPANFFAAQSHTTRASLLTGLKDNISEAIQTVKAADSGIKGLLSTIESLRGVITSARTAINDTVNSATTLGGSPAGGTEGLTGQYNRLVGQLNNLVTDSSYKGTNFLTSGGVTLTVNFNENSTTNLTMSGFNAGASGLAISGGGTSLTVAGTTGNLTSGDLDTVGELNSMEATLNTAIATLQSRSSELAANLGTLSARQTFINEMVNTLNIGATHLTEADSNEEGANLISLQTKLQLGTTALSISSQAEQSVLRLF